MNDNCRTFRPHPIYVVQFIRRFLVLLLIPVLRGLLYLFTGQFSAWLRGAWFDLVLVFCLLLFSFSLWFACVIRVSPKSVTVSQGILFRRTFYVPTCRFTCLTAVYSFYLKPLRAVHLRIDTSGGKFRKADLVLTISKKHWEETQTIIQPSVVKAIPSKVYSPKNSYVLLLAALTSNSFAGILFLSTLITQIGSILGAEFSERIYGAFETTTRQLALDIPPVAVAAGVLLLVGWILTFILNAIRHKNLLVRRTSSTLEISGGLFTQRTYYLHRHQIGFLDIRQTLLTLPLNLSSAFVYTIGYGKYNDDLDSIIPCADPRDLKNRLAQLLPEYHISPRQVGPRRGRILPPAPMTAVAMVLTVPVAAMILLHFFPDWDQLILWASIFCFIPALWYFVIRSIECRTAGISLHRGCWTLRYSKGFCLHTVLIQQEKVSNMVLIQSPWQRFRRRCSLLVCAYTERRNLHVIRNLPLAEAEALIYKQKKR